MALLQWMCLLTLLAPTMQISVSMRAVDDGADPDGTAPPFQSIHEFGGIFDLVAGKEDFEAAQEQDAQQLVGLGRHSAENLPAGSWKAPKATGDRYPGSGRWPLATERKCTADDMKELNYWALRQAKTRLPAPGYNGTFETGSCHKNNYWGQWAGLGVRQWAQCYQRFYNVSTGCAQCVGAVYNMAIYNWSQPCYKFCFGRPNRRDGSHWCWEDCQSCMWYIGHQLSICYGEPYDMTCRYAKELGKEGWFEKNGINPKR